MRDEQRVLTSLNYCFAEFSFRYHTIIIIYTINGIACVFETFKCVSAAWADLVGKESICPVQTVVISKPHNKTLYTIINGHFIQINIRILRDLLQTYRQLTNVMTCNNTVLCHQFLSFCNLLKCKRISCNRTNETCNPDWFLQINTK